MARKSPTRPDSSSADGFWYDAAAAQWVVDFFKECLVHTKGELAGQPFVLSPWQEQKIIRPLFGWKRPDKTRKYREAYIEVPRKSGKSTLGAGIALYLLFADGEPGAEIYSAAGDKDQARIVFNDAKLMRQASPELRRHSKAFKDSIVVHETASRYRVLSADAPTKHGLNPHAILFDELHVQPNRELWDALTTGLGARTQPLVVTLTTAGFDRNSLCWEKHDYALKVLDGSVQDPAFLPVIFAADPKEDEKDPTYWRRPETWRLANPGLGISVKEDFLVDQVKKAEESLPYLNTFKRLYLNLWTESAVRAISPEAWARCGEPFDEAALEGRMCYGGMDLSKRDDITAFVLLFPPTDDDPVVRVLCRFWCPKEKLRAHAERDHAPYVEWAQSGDLIATEGDIVDYDVVREEIQALGSRYQIREIAFDKWNATQIVTQLREAGADLVEYPQGFSAMSAPTKELINGLIAGGTLRHGGQPVLSRMAANMVLAKDGDDRWKPVKAKSTGRIDGMVALIMALGRHMGGKPEEFCGVSTI